MNDEERVYNLEEIAAAGPHQRTRRDDGGKGRRCCSRFRSPDLDGTVVRLSDFRGKRHVVIMTGAVTSPMCAFEIPALNQLQHEFESQGVSFFFLYTRESHPAENYPLA